MPGLDPSEAPLSKHATNYDCTMASPLSPQDGKRPLAAAEELLSIAIAIRGPGRALACVRAPSVSMFKIVLTGKDVEQIRA